jgi:hypothetical protein
VHLTNIAQLLQLLYGGSQRNTSGTYGNQSAVHHVASLAAEPPTTSKTARTGKVASVSTLLRQAGTRSQEGSADDKQGPKDNDDDFEREEVADLSQ